VSGESRATSTRKILLLEFGHDRIAEGNREEAAQAHQPAEPSQQMDERDHVDSRRQRTGEKRLPRQKLEACLDEEEANRSGLEGGARLSLPFDGAPSVPGLEQMLAECQEMGELEQSFDLKPILRLDFARSAFKDLQARDPKAIPAQLQDMQTKAERHALRDLEALVPTLRGVPRLAPGAAIPAAAPLWISYDAAGSAHELWTAPTARSMQEPATRRVGIRRHSPTRTVEAVDA